MRQGEGAEIGQVGDTAGSGSAGSPPAIIPPVPTTRATAAITSTRGIGGEIAEMADAGAGGTVRAGYKHIGGDQAPRGVCHVCRLSMGRAWAPRAYTSHHDIISSSLRPGRWSHCDDRGSDRCLRRDGEDGHAAGPPGLPPAVRFSLSDPLFPRVQRNCRCGGRTDRAAAPGPAAIKGVREDAIPTIGYLAQRLRIQHHSAVELVDRLVEAGLIVARTRPRGPSAGPPRVTASAEQHLATLSASHLQELRRCARHCWEILNQTNEASDGGTIDCAGGGIIGPAPRFEARGMIRLACTSNPGRIRSAVQIVLGRNRRLSSAIPGHGQQRDVPQSSPGLRRGDTAPLGEMRPLCPSTTAINSEFERKRERGAGGPHLYRDQLIDMTSLVARGWRRNTARSASSAGRSLTTWTAKPGRLSQTTTSTTRRGDGHG